MDIIWIACYCVFVTLHNGHPPLPQWWTPAIQQTTLIVRIVSQYSHSSSSSADTTLFCIICMHSLNFCAIYSGHQLKA